MMAAALLLLGWTAAPIGCAFARAFGREGRRAAAAGGLGLAVSGAALMLHAVARLAS